MKNPLKQIAAFLKIDKIFVNDKGEAVFNDEQKKKLMTSLKLDDEAYKKFVSGVNSALTNESNASAAELELQAAHEALNADSSNADNANVDNANADNANADNANADNANVDNANANLNIVSQIQGLQQKIDKLEEDPDKQNVKIVDPKNTHVPFNNVSSTKDHLFSIDHPFFSREKWWNESAAIREPSKSRNALKEKQAEDTFMIDFKEYTASLSERYYTLQQEGKLGVLKDPKSGSIDYTDLETQWGAEYYVRRQDALIAYIMDVPTVTDIFPVRYGIQDKEEMTNSFFTDFSQGYQNSEAAAIYKGAYKLQPEIANINDAMFKHKFSDLKKLEKEHIGYLNREGSDPIKLTFIEWLVGQTGRKLIIEQNQRRVIGHYTAIVTDVPNHHLQAADGVIAKVQKYVDAFKIQPFATKNTYTKSTILAYVEDFFELVNQILPGTLDGWQLYINAKHIPWYTAGYRDAYGADTDFGGSKIKAIDYSLESFIPVPNMETTDYRMWMTMPNNIELMEVKAGEMLAMYFERRFENLYAMSWWGEGVSAYLSGQEFADAATILANNYKNQFIFTNDPYTALAEDATTVDGSVNTLFQTIANTGATAITDITTSTEGRVYRITLGSTTNPSNIAKAAKFSEISAAWTPTAVGDFLEVYHRVSDDKFIEVSRRVT